MMRKAEIINEKNKPSKEKNSNALGASRGKGINGGGILNREQRYALAYRALESGIEKNANGTVILVEGKRDEIALRGLGFKGPIEKLNRGWTIDRVVVFIAETYGECIVLMDWDRTGGRLQRRLMDSMIGLDIKPSDELRRALSKAMKPDTMCVEALTSFLGQPNTRFLYDV